MCPCVHESSLLIIDLVWVHDFMSQNYKSYILAMSHTSWVIWLITSKASLLIGCWELTHIGKEWKKRKVLRIAWFGEKIDQKNFSKIPPPIFSIFFQYELTPSSQWGGFPLKSSAKWLMMYDSWLMKYGLMASIRFIILTHGIMDSY